MVNNEDYLLRIKKYFKLINPKYSLLTENKIKDILLNGSKNEISLLKESVIHKNNDQPIFWLFRYSSFIPVNIPICFGLITSKTIYGQMLWQVINQSYNVGFNYANKPISNTKSNDYDLINMYSFAVASSCTISGLITYYTKNIFVTTSSHFTHTLLRGFIPFTSVFLSSTANLYYVRKNDFNNGIKLYDNNYNEVGVSKNMAFSSFTETATCRTIFRFASCIFPPIIEYVIMKNKNMEIFMKNNPRIWTLLRLSIITTCLYTSMPFAFAYYPQVIKVNEKTIEKEHKDKDLYYNRGI